MIPKNRPFNVLNPYANLNQLTQQQVSLKLNQDSAQKAEKSSSPPQRMEKFKRSQIVDARAKRGAEIPTQAAQKEAPK